MNKPLIMGASLSPFVRKTLLFAHEAGIDFNFKMTRPHDDDPQFKAASPLGKIPAMVHGDVTAADSTVIMHYLHRAFNTSLLPSDDQGFADALWWEEYADTVMTSHIILHLYAEVVMAKAFFNREPIQADIDKARNDEIPAICGFIESRLQHDFLVGDTISMADIAVGGIFIAMHHGGETIDADQYPNLAAWWSRVSQRPSFQQVINMDTTVMGKLGFNSPLA